MTARIKIIQETTLYKGWSTLKKYIISYTRRDGRKEKHTREIYNSGDGAAVLLYNPSEKKILLIRQFRLPVLLSGHPTGFIIECCAGMLDELDPEQAIIKEIKEETGYQVQEVTKIYEAFATPGAHMEKIHFYTAKYDATMKLNSGGGELSEQEDIELLEYDYGDIQGLLNSGEIIDAKTIVLLQWAWRELV
ncbi:MAG: NUDIX domain-containing protein [Saprospiraceae bacterium]|nr:NUDIX domain-containing protein [Saprospiraceae bacterium]